LVILLVTIVSFFVERDTAGRAVVAYIEGYVPIGDDTQRQVLETIAGMVKTRGQAGGVAFLVLLWVSIQCVVTLISATNRAWDTPVDKWWKLPLKSLVVLGMTAGVVLVGMGVTVVVGMGRSWFLTASNFDPWAFALVSFLIPLFVTFLSLGLFYRLAPHRPTRFAHVWVAALFATVLLRAAESLFVIYLERFAKLNAVYGAFGGIVALLLWIYLSGGIFIFGACLCAARAEALPVPQSR
jgi:Ca2+-transporting ATPase